MLWKVVGWIVVIWLVIYAINHPGAVTAHVQNAWHAIFSSAA